MKNARCYAKPRETKRVEVGLGPELAPWELALVSGRRIVNSCRAPVPRTALDGTKDAYWVTASGQSANETARARQEYPDMPPGYNGVVLVDRHRK